MVRVAVIIPVYNNIGGLLKTLKSIEDEGENVDIIVVDDGSVPAVNTSLEEDIKQKITVITQVENRGIEHALNEGIKYVLKKKEYEYIGRLDAGDTVLNNRFLKQVKYLDENSECMLVGSHVEFVNENGKRVFVQNVPITSNEIAKKMHDNSCFSHPAVLFRVSAVKELGFYSLDYVAAEDYEYFFRFVKKYQTANVDEILTSTELNETGISLTKRKQQLKSRMKIQLKHFNTLRLTSYVGILKTCVLYVVPTKVIIKIKNLIHN